jgi:hypothetical protein
MPSYWVVVAEDSGPLSPEAWRRGDQRHIRYATATGTTDSIALAKKIKSQREAISLARKRRGQPLYIRGA